MKKIINISALTLFALLISVIKPAQAYESTSESETGITAASISDTLVATMYEREKGDFSIGFSGEGGVLGTFKGDEYFYRLSKTESGEEKLVDVQWTGGLSKLTPSDQSSYYEDFWKISEGAYEFTWLVSMCTDDSAGPAEVFGNASFSPDRVKTTFQEIDNNGFASEAEAFWKLSPYSGERSLREGVLVDDFDEASGRLSTYQYWKRYSNDTEDPLRDRPEESTKLSFPGFNLDGQTEYMLKSSAAHAQISCKGDSSPVWIQLTDQNGSPLTSKSIELDEGLFVDLSEVTPGDSGVVPVDLDGAYVAVYGDGPPADTEPLASVSHFGLTKIEDPNYTVSYHPNGASGGTLPADDSASAGSFSPTTNTGNLKRPGFTFKGWSTDFKASSAMSTVNLSSDTRLYAVWEEQSSGTVSDPTPYSGPIITTVGFGPDATYSSTSTSPIVISGERLSGVSGARVAGKQAEILSVNSDNFTILLPKGLTVGTHDLSIETNLGNLTYLDAITIAAVEGYGDVKAWTKRISDDQAKVYVKYPTVGEKVRIGHQTGGSGSYESVYVKTTSSETMEGLSVVDGVGTYIVRTIDLDDINRIRVTVGEKELVQVRYNN